MPRKYSSPSLSTGNALQGLLWLLKMQVVLTSIYAVFSYNRWILWIKGDSWSKQMEQDGTEIKTYVLFLNFPFNIFGPQLTVGN